MMIQSEAANQAQSNRFLGYYPLLLAFRRVSVCEKISHMATKLSEGCEQIIEVYTPLVKLMKVNYGATVEKASAFQEDMHDLKIKAMITGAAISTQCKSPAEWMKMVHSGTVIDVFSEEGVNRMMRQLYQVRLFIFNAMLEGEKIMAAVQSGSTPVED